MSTGDIGKIDGTNGKREYFPYSNGYFDNDYQNYRLLEYFAFLYSCVYNKAIRGVVEQYGGEFL